MFILNVKLNYKKILIGCIICGAIIASIVEFGIKDNMVETNSNMDKFDYEITDKNFVDCIEKIHNNIDENVNKTIKLSGFVYTLADFKDEFFICGRYMTVDMTHKVQGICAHIKETYNL